jgi:cytochrome P450
MTTHGANVANVARAEWAWRRKAMAGFFQGRFVFTHLLDFAVKESEELVARVRRESDGATALCVDPLMQNTTVKIILYFLLGEEPAETLDPEFVVSEQPNC